MMMICHQKCSRTQYQYFEKPACAIFRVYPECGDSWSFQNVAAFLPVCMVSRPKIQYSCVCCYVHIIRCSSLNSEWYVLLNQFRHFTSVNSHLAWNVFVSVGKHNCWLASLPTAVHVLHGLGTQVMELTHYEWGSGSPRFKVVAAANN
jgi:hypothetical protein